MDFKIPNFEYKEELFDFLVKNEEDIIYSKKNRLKMADVHLGYSVLNNEHGIDIKKNADLSSKSSIQVRSVINTTNLLDSYGEVHIDGLWGKTVKENRLMKHLQEHQMKFDKIIADGDDLKVSVKKYNWRDLGYNAEGTTQALVFDSNIKKERNPFMFEQYAKGYVNQHSVGMYVIKLATCINDKDYETQYANWEKYYPLIANKSDLNKEYFWAILEAKAVEGSAVPLGACFVTPTQSVKEPELEIKSNPYLEFLKS